MDEKAALVLIEILQKHANAIRKLQIANIALMTLAREEATLRGETPEQFDMRFLELLSSVEAKAPSLHPEIAKEIEETMAELIALEKLAKKPLN